MVYQALPVAKVPSHAARDAQLLSFASVPDVASFDESRCKRAAGRAPFANAGLKRNPKGVYERIAHVARSFTENGRYSAEEGQRPLTSF